MYGAADDLPLVCRGVEERLLGFKGPGVGVFRDGDGACDVETSMRSPGVDCER